jgi:pimeloyl-ACP methyl ester carboxylesterase
MRSVSAFALAVALAPSAVAAQRLEMKPCTVEGVPAPARCGDLAVPENREAPTGRKISLHVVLIPAASKQRAPDAFTFFEGGPGQAAARDAAGVLEDYARIHQHRDIFLVDQRGTGNSSPLTCQVFGGIDSLQGWLGSFIPVEGVKACRGKLAPTADLASYTTNNHADDIDEVRAALGYDKIDVGGWSYGSRAALVYLKRHEKHVRSVVIGGIDPTTDFTPETFARDAQTAVEGVFSECDAEAACQAAFPNIRAELKQVIARLDSAPVRVQVIHPVSGDVVSVSLNRDLFGEAIRYMLYSTGGASWIPATVHAAALGNFAPMADRAVFGRKNIVGDDGMLYLTVTCNEDVPFVDQKASEQMGRETFLGNYRLRDQTNACAEWPHKPVDRSFQEPTRSAVPVLLFSGERDPVTPPSNGALAAKTLSNSLHLVVKSGGHGYAGLIGADCVNKLMNDFVEHPNPRTLDTSCMTGIHRAPFPTALQWSDPIALDAGELQNFVGSFVGDPSGPSGITRMEKGKLHLEVVGFDDLVLVPVGPATFRAAGAPFTVKFQLESSHVSRVVLEQNGQPMFAMKPKA